MKKINNFLSIWTPYYLIVVVSISISIALLFYRYESIKNEICTGLKYQNSLMAESIHSSFHQKTSLLKVLGQRIVELGALEQSPKATILINEFLKDNPEVVGFGLALPNGKLTITSFNIDRSQLPNLLVNPKTSESFKQALIQDKLIIGQTYYMKALKKWLIPIRYRITNDLGDTLAVMTAGIDVSLGNQLWASNKLPKDVSFMVIRHDHYRQFVASNSKLSEDDAYSHTIPKERYDAFYNRLIEQSKHSIQSGTPYLIKTSDLYNDLQLVAVEYNEEFNHLTLTYFPHNEIYKKLSVSFFWIIALLILFNGSLYLIFSNILKLQKESKETLKFQANHDQLTELPNRYYLNSIMNDWSQKNKGCFSMLFIDLDNFKSSNDLYGHSVGDQILFKIASRIKKVFSEGVVIRQGGDEFIVLYPHFDSEKLNEICLIFLHELKKPIMVNGYEFVIGASIGISIAPDHGDSIDDLLRKADMAMFYAKERKLNTYTFNSELELKTKRIAVLESELANAIENNEFYLVYQPQIDAQTQHIIGVETLIRWENEALGFVPPDEFIPIAESTGIINQIGIFVLETAITETNQLCQTLKEMNLMNTEKFTNNKRLSINVSVHQLLSEDFIESVKRNLRNHLCPEFSIMLEVTENLFIDDIEKVNSVLSKAKKLGISISMDDFGTGYSSLSVIKNLPLDELKIDKSFIDSMLSDHQSLSLVESIIDIGHNLKIPVIAEGVENDDQAFLLNELGCDFFQGYLYSKPLKKDDLLSYVINKMDESSLTTS